ncbi:MAG: acyl CoA:acetate/3-ketoacid CoA transferase [Agarilytica sp.]
MYAKFQTAKHKPVTRNKIVSASEAVNLINSGDTLATGGFVGIGFAEELAIALRERFDRDQSPRDLTLVYAAGQGDGGDKGLNHIAKQGLIKRAIGGHWGLVPELQKLANDNKIEAYNLPQGCLAHLFRDIAAGKPGTISRVGLGTFVDPRFDGGKLNESTQEDLVKLLEIEGEEYLFYKSFPINVAFIRGTTADEAGNVTCEKEALYLESLALATAAHNSGGLVIVQVERVAQNHSLNPRDVKIPGIMVDCVVVADPKHHWQTFAEPYNPAFAGAVRQPMHNMQAMDMNARKIIARRAAFELRPNAVVNLGIGMPEGIAQVANEEHVLDKVTLTAEPGLIGGLPANGLNFGAGVNIDALIDQPSQFDFYDGGGLDIAFLGLAQADRHGNVNVSKFGSRLAGAGGFINISQNAKKLVFVGTFSAGKYSCTIKEGEISLGDGKQITKFLEEVEHVTFSGTRSASLGQPVLFITERCVFKLTSEGLNLIEIAPGLDLQKDILDHMNFEPIISENLIPMDRRIFQEEPMGLESVLLHVPIERRIDYDADSNLLFINFEALAITVPEEVDSIKETVENMLKPLNCRVNVIVNYDNFTIRPDLVAYYSEAVKELVDKYYEQVTRYTTSAFLRMKLGESIGERGAAPHIFESESEASAFTDSKED